MASEPLIEWPQPLMELLGFVGAFLSMGAVGFRLAVLRGRPETRATTPEERSVYAQAAQRAARLGLTGVLIAAVMLATRLPAFAARRHTTIPSLIAGEPQLALQIGLLLLALIGFSLAAGRRPFGWSLAAVGILISPLGGLIGGHLARVVNPLHVLGGGLWIGTLMQLVVVGIGGTLKSKLSPDRQGAVVAGMVRGFSPLALGAFALLAAMGLTTAWRNLKRLDALWSTPYGITLLIKLAVVAGVLALGAHNWRRLKPTLGGEVAARTLFRSARNELLLGALVLVITSILVSLPSPGE